LQYQPETKFVYSVGPDVQARLVEVLSGMKFDEFLERRLFEPLGMKDAGFWVPSDKGRGDWPRSIGPETGSCGRWMKPTVTPRVEYSYSRGQ